MPWPENIVPVGYPSGDEAGIGEVIANASNVSSGDNPAYDIATDFLAIYPQFGGGVVPLAVLTMYCNLANASVKQYRYQDAWYVCMGLFIAHFCHLYLESANPAGTSARKVLASGQAKGLPTSQGAGGVSNSVDYTHIATGLEGWVMWNATTYGQQFVTFAKLAGIGGMGIW